jgi:hypothetical protein
MGMIAPRSGARDPVAATPQGFDRLARAIRVEFATQPTDEDFNGVAVAFEVLLVELLREFGL